jgi:ABC-type hemin transport system ATPase subunit
VKYLSLVLVQARVVSFNFLVQEVVIEAEVAEEDSEEVEEHEADSFSTY